MQNIKPLEIQVKKLKLNVTNIKSSLINGNKNTKKIRAEEKSLLLSKKRESQKLKKEEFVEGKGITSKIGGAAKNIAAPAMSFLDKIKEFFSLVLLGIIVNNLPQAIKKVQEFIKDNRWLFDAIKAVFASLEFVVPVFREIVNFFNPSRREAYDNTKKELKEKLAALTGNIGALDKEAGAVEKELKEELDEQPDEPINRTDDELTKDIKSAIKDQKVTEKSFKKSLNNYRTSINNNKKTAEPIQVPGVGSFERTGGPLGMGTKVVTKDTFGREITPKTFDERVLTAIGQNKGGSFNDDFLKLAQGGLVRGATGEEKIALKDAQSFSELKESALISSKILGSQEDTNDEFKKLTDNFKSYLNLTKEYNDGNPIDPSNSPFTLPTPQHQGPTIQPPAPDPNAKGSVVTFDSAQGKDRSGEPGVDFSFADIYSNYSIFPGKVVEVGSLYGSGYGRHVTVRSVDQDGEQFDALYAHFGRFAVKEGDTVKSGDYLGTVGWDSSRGVPMTGAGNMTGPHTSVDFYEPNTRRGQVTPKYSGSNKLSNLIINHANKDVKTIRLGSPGQNLTPKQKSSMFQKSGMSPTAANALSSAKPPGGGRRIQSKQIIPAPEGLLEPLTPFQLQHFSGGKGRGLRRSEQLTQTFDGVGGATEVVIIKSTQPIVVPGPTRYIRR